MKCWKRRYAWTYLAEQSGVYWVQQRWVPFYYYSYLPTSCRTLGSHSGPPAWFTSPLLQFVSSFLPSATAFWQASDFSHNHFKEVPFPKGLNSSFCLAYRISSPVPLSRFSHFTLLLLEPSSFLVLALEGTFIPVSSICQVNCLTLHDPWPNSHLDLSFPGLFSPARHWDRANKQTLFCLPETPWQLRTLSSGHFWGSALR